MPHAIQTLRVVQFGSVVGAIANGPSMPLPANCLAMQVMILQMPCTILQAFVTSTTVRFIDMTLANSFCFHAYPLA